MLAAYVARILPGQFDIRYVPRRGEPQPLIRVDGVVVHRGRMGWSDMLSAVRRAAAP